MCGEMQGIKDQSLDGKRLDVTASLECALRHVRDGFRTLLIWADGVCINQNDVQDRNEQVRFMGNIYYNAVTTIIFLGPSSPEIDHAIRSMNSQHDDYFDVRRSVTSISVVEQVLARP